jgi:methionyl-tRNA synthetase
LELARAGNVFFDRQRPWELVRSDIQRCGTVLNVCLQVIQGLAVLMAPYLPLKAQELWEMLGMPGSVDDQSWRDVGIPAEAGRPIPRPHPLIAKLDADDVARKLGLPTMAELRAEVEAEAAAACPADVLDLVVGRITSVEVHPDADKLWVMAVDMGDSGLRTLVAGLRGHYSEDELAGSDIVVVANLQPAKLRGVRSEGMLLAAEDEDGTVSLLRPAGPAKPGDRLWSPVPPEGKGLVEFKAFTGISLRTAAREDVGDARVKEGLDLPATVVVTPDGEGLRVLHTPDTVITLDRPVRSGSAIH